MELKRKVIGITGGISSGKSTFCKTAIGYLQEIGIEANWIEVDLIRRHVLYESEKIEHSAARSVLLDALDMKEMDPSAFSGIIFSSRRKMEIYREIMNPEIIKEIKERIRKLQGIILVEWAMLVEDGMLALTNNNVILMDIDKEIQLERLKDSDLSSEELKKRLAFTEGNGTTNRRKIIKDIQKEKGEGKFLRLDSRIEDNEKIEMFTDLFLNH